MLSSISITKKKQNGTILSQSEIEFIIQGYIAGTINDDDMTNWLKAVFQQGMTHKETMDYTQNMIESGAQLDFSHLNGYVVDKHSTGGVGDKVSMILGPLLAACGCYIPMVSGRGLGHTQGTIDKLESIPGYCSSLSLTQFKRIVEEAGISIIAQTEEICPADSKIYALRDITDTVASFPLICGSIMSKKIAEGIEGLVLDIKVGNGAFIRTLSEAKKLGALMQDVGKHYGIHVSICYTGMDQPLGNTAGLWCEVMESIECLKGNGPDDIMSIVFHLGKEALTLAKIHNAEPLLKTAISDGSALDKFRHMVSAHGGNLGSMDNPKTYKPLYQKEVLAESEGYICYMDTLNLGKGVVYLGGGRIQKRDKLDPTVGIVWHKKTGDAVVTGEPIMTYFCSDKDKFERCKLYFKGRIRIQSELPKSLELIYKS